MVKDVFHPETCARRSQWSSYGGPYVPIYLYRVGGIYPRIFILPLPLATGTITIMGNTSSTMQVTGHHNNHTVDPNSKPLSAAAGDTFLRLSCDLSDSDAETVHSPHPTPSPPHSRSVPRTPTAPAPLTTALTALTTPHPLSTALTTTTPATTALTAATTPALYAVTALVTYSSWWLYHSLGALPALFTTPEYDKTNVTEAIAKLQSTLAFLDTKISTMTGSVDKYAHEARRLYARKNRTGAMHQLRLKKMYEREITKMDSLKFNLESNILHMESVGVMMETVSTIKETSHQFQVVSKHVDFAKLEDSIEEMFEQRDTSKDIESILHGMHDSHEFDDEELLAELETMVEGDEGDGADGAAGTVGVAAATCGDGDTLWPVVPVKKPAVPVKLAVPMAPPVPHVSVTPIPTLPTFPSPPITLPSLPPTEETTEDTPTEDTEDDLLLMSR